MQEFQAQILTVNKLSKQTYQIDLRPLAPDAIEFEAGQYICVHVGDVGGQPDYRSYSIASPAHQDDQFTLCIKVEPDSHEERFWSQLTPGEEIRYTAPQGHFLIEEEDPNRHWIFAASGTGIAPLRSMILDLFHEGTWRRVDLYFGVRWEEDLVFKEEFEQLAEQHNNFHFFPSITRESDSWKGRHGRITKHLKKDLVTGEGISAYICGGSEMVAEVADLLEDQGVDENYIYTEDFSAPLSSKH